MPGEKRLDVLATISQIEHLLYQCRGGGMTVKDLSGMTGVDVRTIQRYIKRIEQDNIFPIEHEGNKYRLVMKGYLPALRFNSLQGLYIFIACRLMAGLFQRYDTDIAAIFNRFNSVMRPPLQDEISKTLKWMAELPAKPRLTWNMDQLAQAWLNAQRVEIEYKSLEAARYQKRKIDVYFIQPSLPGHSCYIIAYCHKAGAVRVFKAERIRTMSVLQENYSIPSDFDANSYLSAAWGIVTDGTAVEVRLKLDKSLAVLAEETTWHASQKSETQPDGSVMLTFQVSLSPELTNWIMGWGDRIEVLAPAALRQEVAGTAAAMVKLYAAKKRGRA